MEVFAGQEGMELAFAVFAGTAGAFVSLLLHFLVMFIVVAIINGESGWGYIHRFESWPIRACVIFSLVPSSTFWFFDNFLSIGQDWLVFNKWYGYLITILVTVLFSFLMGIYIKYKSTSDLK
jgi:hypothetical protein